jgi:L-rhamnose mutarotase
MEAKKMQRRVWLLHIKRGKEEEYRRRHEAVWPALIEAARKAGLKNHSCFLSAQQVIVYAEAENIDNTFGELTASDVKKQWDDWMSEVLDEDNGIKFEEVFHFD